MRAVDGRLTGVVLLLVVLIGGGVWGPSMATAEGCVPGVDGCIPDAASCASGGRNGLWLGRHVGRAAVCASVAGSTFYVGGNAQPPSPCGTIVVADQQLSGEDPNACNAGPFAGGSLRFRVQLPSDYTSSEARYPVLYLLPGGGSEDAWFYADPALPSLADAGVIIVSVFSNGGRFNDWRDGELAFETMYTQVLPALIDANLRTIADRSHRAIAGVSEGGYGAMLYAARHPELYVAAAAFSGALDITHPLFFYGIESLAGSAFMPYDDPMVGPWPVFGDPIREEVWWRGRNPTDLAPNLHGTALWASAGDGVPTTAELAADPTVLVWGTAIEVMVRQMTDRFDDALGAAGIERTILRRPGIHDAPYAVADLHRWFPVMLQTFGAPAPAAIDHRSVDPVVSVWGWQIEADPARAVEFLEIEDASQAGFGLTGSGLTRVTTPALFAPGQVVALCGATSPSATASDDGRLTLMVDLGAPHALQQYTPAQRAVEAASAGGYFVTKRVAFGGPCHP